MNLSVVVPVLNEAAGIRDFVRHLRARLPRAEIIIVDGGSSDGTCGELEGLQQQLCFRLLRSRRGRARQMNSGAEVATGETLLFLHADSRLPVACEAAIAELLEDVRYSGGCFRLRFARPELIYRISDSLGNLAVDLFRIALGDHGIFCRRQAYLRAGGFPDIPLMEDAEFYRALRRAGRVRQLRAEIETSARRYEANGPYRTTLFYLLILGLYLLRVPPERLASRHRRFTSHARSLGAQPRMRWQPTKWLPSVPRRRFR